MSDAVTRPNPAFEDCHRRQQDLARSGWPRRTRVGVVRILLLTVVALSLACESPEASLRLYVLDGGTLTNPDPSWASLTLAEIKGFTSVPVPAYLVVHPEGVILWDTGLGDSLAGRPTEETQRGSWGLVVTSTIRDQLAEIGYSPDDITYLILSHSHFDHAGNANDYAGSTWIVQQAELDWIDELEAWGPISRLQDSEKVVVVGDHDVFGDGTVILKSTPGHTPGHQSLFVDLANTGPLVLSGDLYHFEAHRRLNRVRDGDDDPTQTAASRASLETFISETGAQLWIQHELMLWATLDRAPAYYD